mmetsp:Transcript_90789/g.189802  ORF Transcript_90789/g.189802 Transcript_90789/m.189802 type:complete len:595 (-) Transcript_90789:54-1838(-)
MLSTSRSAVPTGLLLLSLLVALISLEPTTAIVTNSNFYADRESCTQMGCGGVGHVCSCRANCTQTDACCSDYAEVCQERPPPLQLRDINLVFTTDLHAWLSPRVHEPFLNASIAHVVSLVDHLRQLAAVQQRDVFFFDNGDINDGTGLSASSQDHVGALLPILLGVGFDALNIGNHELYQLNLGNEGQGEACAITGMRTRGYLDAYGGRYLTSNVVWASNNQTVGRPFIVLHGEFGTKLLVFGFLYNMEDHCDAVRVLDVAAVVQSAWFVKALEGMGRSSDAIVVLAHMDYRDELVEVILTAIRGVLGEAKPVQFITGHSHIRGWRRVDAYSSSFEAGCKLNTLGYTSFNKEATTAKLDFYKADITGNIAEFERVSNASQASSALSPKGKAVQKILQKMDSEYNLTSTLGCSPRRYQKWVPMTSPNSLAALYMNEVLPKFLFDSASDRPQWTLLGSSALGYDIFEGPITRNDIYTTSPYGNFWFQLEGVRGWDLQELQKRLVRLHAWTEPKKIASGLPPYISTGDTWGWESYNFVYCDFDALTFEGTLREILKGKLPTRTLFRPDLNTSSVLTKWAESEPCHDGVHRSSFLRRE